MSPYISATVKELSNNSRSFFVSFAALDEYRIRVSTSECLHRTVPLFQSIYLQASRHRYWFHQLARNSLASRRYECVDQPEHREEDLVDGASPSRSAPSLWSDSCPGGAPSAYLFRVIFDLELSEMYCLLCE